MIERVHLTFVLDEDKTRVLSRLNFKPNYEGEAPPPLSLDGARLRRCCSVYTPYHTDREGFAITK